MYTLFDFITHVKGIEYLIALLAIAGFILFWEVIKPGPFKCLIASGREDLEYVRREGYGTLFRTMGKIVTAPFIGLAYILILPFAFLVALGYAAASLAFKGFGGVLNFVGTHASFGWRPTEAYLGGRKKEKKAASEARNDGEE